MLLKDDKIHKVTVIIRDYLNNASTLEFEVKAGTKMTECIYTKPKGTILPCNQSATFKKWDIQVLFPHGVLFDSLDFEYAKQDPLPKLFSACHRLHNEWTPLNDFITVSIKPINLPEELKSKACLVKLGAKGGYSYVGGGFDNGFVTGQTRKFGTFAVAVDKTPPTITPITGKAKKIKKSRRSKKALVIQPSSNGLTFRISDNLSGISTYCAYVNDEWVLMTFNPKGSTVKYTYDEHLNAGVNHFELYVTDKKGNTSFYSTEIKR